MKVEMKPLLSYLDFLGRLRPCHQGNNHFLGLVKCRGYERILSKSVSWTEKHLSVGKRLCNDLMQVTIRGFTGSLLFLPPSPPFALLTEKKICKPENGFLEVFNQVVASGTEYQVSLWDSQRFLSVQFWVVTLVTVTKKI